MQVTTMAVVSLIVLIATIAVGVKVKNVPMGILAIGVAFLLGLFVCPEGETAAMSVGKAKLLTNGFNYTMWLTLMSVSIFFGIGQENGSLAKLTKKMVYVVGGKRVLLPFVFLIVAYAISAVGLSGVGTTILLMPFAAQVAKNEKVPFMLPCYAIAVGGAAGAFSPVASFRFIVEGVVEANGIQHNSNTLFAAYTLCGFIAFLLIYIIFKGYKLNESGGSSREKVEAFNFTDWATYLSILGFAFGAIIGGYDAGMCAIVMACVLAIVTKANVSKIIKERVAWNTLILLGGMGILINVVSKAGGIDLLVSFFSMFMTKRTAAPFTALMAASMSLVSSATGVVYPALIPTVPDLVATTGASAQALVDAIAYGALQTGICPFSVTGGLILALGGEDIDQKKVFLQLIVMAVGLALLSAFFSFVGLLF